MTTKQHIDPRTAIGRATLRYRGLPTRHLLSMLGMGTDSSGRPYYSRDELISMLVDRDLKWFTEFGHLNRGDMLTSEQHRCHNEKKKFQRRV